MKYQVVTSMSLEGYNQYGQNFIDTYSRFWDIPLVIYSEDSLDDERFLVRNLKYDEELQDFLKASPEDSVDYRWKVKKFAHKVFALTDRRLRDCDWLIWLDADVVTFRNVDDRDLFVLCPAGYIGSYLGRKDWHTSECGFVGYNLGEGAERFLDRFRAMYTTMAVFDHLEWHDSYLFDRLREICSGKWFNLSEGVPGMHVWDGSLLGKYMKHLKGPLRKSGQTANVREDYWSASEESQKTLDMIGKKYEKALKRLASK